MSKNCWVNKYNQNPVFLRVHLANALHKKKFSIKNFFRKCDQICRKLRIWSHLLKKSLKKKRHFLCIDGSSEPINPWHFLKELNKIFKMHLNILSRLWLIVCCHQQKIKKMRHFGHFNDYNFGSKQDK